jgi:DNA-binding PadR family transcriptional regulator
MHKHALPILIASGALLAGCGSKTDANDKNFSAALDQYFAKNGDVCLGSMHARKWPVDVVDTTGQKFVASSYPTDQASQLKALQSAGLAKSTHMEVERPMSNGRMQMVWRYELTDAGKKALRENARVSGVSDLCFANKRLDKIVKWDAVQSFGGATGTNVTYLYKLEGMQDWAAKPEIQAAYPGVKAIIAGVGKEEGRQGVKLTNLGWEALGL